MKRASAPSNGSTAGLRTVLLLFVIVLVVLFHGVFLPGQTLFSNDGPLSQQMSECHRLPARFTGCWLDLGGVGLNGGTAVPDVTYGILWLLGPLWYSKLYAILSLLLLGVGAWYFFLQSRLTPVACVLGGLAAILNSTFFSVACWGMSAHILAAAMSFLALGALMDRSPRGRWLRVILAGFAIGMGVSEGADVGAILSLYVSAFIVYQALIAEGPHGINLAIGFGKVALVAICAAVLASEAVSALITTSIKGIAGTEQNDQTRAGRWNWATQWSLPKTETLGLVVPGLFGYRMDTHDGGNYWGVIGRDQAWNKYVANGRQGPPPGGYLRYTGSGYYEGVLAVLVAIWGAIQSFRSKDPIFDPEQRKWIWFWTAITVLSLLLALGRFGPLYRWFYFVPYFSTIRNPVKFLYPFSFAIIVLFAYGVDALQRRYMGANGMNTRWAGLVNWWKKAPGFEKYWFYGCGLVAIASMVGGLVYSSQRIKFEDYLRQTGVDGSLDAIFSFSLQRIVIFFVFFLLSVGLMALILSGAFAGKRAKTGGILLGLLMVADLGLANLPWIVYMDYNAKFATNPIIDFLRDQPYQHRVALTPAHLPANEEVLRQLYRIEWLQHEFPYYNIQSFDFADMPRMPEDLAAISRIVSHGGDTNQPYVNLCRSWQLSNTRYILAPLNFGSYWNSQSYLAGNPLQTVTRFDIMPREGVTGPVTAAGQLTAAPTPNGHFAIFQLANTLPRAKLYEQWQVNTNNDTALKQLFSPDFDPQQTVLVNSGGLSDSQTGTTNAPVPGTVEFAHYSPKDILLKAQAATPSLLLLNDHYDPNWKVLVDGQPAELLRCNYLMRGVHLEPGTHLVEFKFRPRFDLLYVSLSANILGLLILGSLAVSANKRSVPPENSGPSPAPVARPVQKPAAEPAQKSKARKNGRNGNK